MDHEKNLKRSFKLWLQNKYLWVMGIILAFFGGGGGSRGNFNTGGGGGNSSSSTGTGELPPELNEGFLKVQDFFENTPKETLLMIVLIFLLIIIIWTLIALYIKNVAKSGLIKASAEIHFRRSPGLGGAWRFGNQNWVKLLYQRFVLFLPIVIIQLIMFLIGGFIVFGLINEGIETAPMRVEEFFESGQIALFILPFCLVMCVVVIYSILASMISPFAERKMIIDGLSPIQSISAGFNFLKDNFSDVAIAYLITIAGRIIIGIIMFVVTLVTVLPITLFVIALGIGNLIAGIIAGIILGFVFMILMAGVQGTILTYWYIYWTGLYLEISKQDIVTIEELEMGNSV